MWPGGSNGALYTSLKPVSQGIAGSSPSSGKPISSAAHSSATWCGRGVAILEVLGVQRNRGNLEQWYGK